MKKQPRKMTARVPLHRKSQPTGSAEGKTPGVAAEQHGDTAPTQPEVAETRPLPTKMVAKAEVREMGEEELEAMASSDEFERRKRAEAEDLFKRLKRDAQANFGSVMGVRTAEEWAEVLERAGDEIGNGRFIVRCLGAERYLAPETVAVLVALRQNLIADVTHATAAEIMMIDAAIMAYYNMVRLQGWVGNLSLVVERELFGEEPFNKYHGQTAGDRLEEQFRRLGEVMLPLQERAARMMMRSLEGLSSVRIAGRQNPKRGRGKKFLFSSIERGEVSRATFESRGQHRTPLGTIR